MVKLAADIGCIGLSVLSQNLILNLDDHGYVVAAYDSHTFIVDAFSEHEAKGTNILCSRNLEEMIKSLKQNPRIVMFREPALLWHARYINDLIQKLETLLSPGDIIIDYSTSCSTNTSVRTEDLKARGILFVGCGIYNDENEARHNPIVRLGGNPQAWPYIETIFQKICSKIDGEPNCYWAGDGGAGHLLMQSSRSLILKEKELMMETFRLMRNVMGMNNREISSILTEWNNGLMKSAFIEKIINIIINYKDGDDPVEVYKSQCGEKGTGKWTAAASEYHRDTGSIYWDSLRYLTSLAANNELVHYERDKEELLENLKNALYAFTVHTYYKSLDWMMSSFIRHRYKKSVPSFSDELKILRGTDKFRCALLSRLEQNILTRFPDLDQYSYGIHWLDGFFTDIIKNNLPAMQKIIEVGDSLNITLFEFRFIFTHCTEKYSI